MYEKTLELMLKRRIVAILRGVADEKLLPLQDTLYQQGIRCIEVTFDQKRGDCLEATARQIRALREHAAGRMEIGAGTVLTEEQVDAAYAAGGTFIISPDSRQEVIARTRALGMVSMPGAMTPTEIVSAYRWGASIVKVFPAGDLGAAYFRSLKGPLGHIPLSAVGGIDHTNMEQFHKAGVQVFGIGSSIAKKELLEVDDFAAIGRNARLYTEQTERW